MWYRKLYWWILIGMAAGLALGYGVSATGTEEIFLPPLTFIGSLFIKLLKMIIVPLVVSSIIVGVSGVGDARRVGRIGLKTGIYYFATTGLSVLVGMILVNIIKPGINANIPMDTDFAPADMAGHSWTNLFLGLVPENPIRSMAEMDILPLIFFSLLFGFVMTMLGKKVETVKKGVEGIFNIMTRMTELIMWLAPVGVMALLAKVVAETGFASLKALARYMLTVLGGLSIHALITLPLILIIFGRYNPLLLFRNMSVALATAFSTSSSSATLPLTMESAEKNVGTSREVSSFVLPLGATINMDGTALYESVAAIFIAQIYLGTTLPLEQQVIVFVTATLAAVGAAGVPNAGMVMMVVVLKAVDLPLEGIGLIYSVDRILDMCRTTINVWGDSIGVTVIAGSEGEDLTGKDGFDT